MGNPLGENMVNNILKNVLTPPPLPSNLDLKEREDKIGKYLKHNAGKFVFAEFSESYLEKAKAKDILLGVPVPLRKEDMEVFAGGSGLSASYLAENMAWVMGSDPHFEHNKAYVAFFKKLYNSKLWEGMVKKGRDMAEKEEYEGACIQFRAALCIQPDYLHAMYSYAKVCRVMYMEGKDPQYIARFKAEAMDFFELLTLVHPKFAEGYYYLGYAYLNLGLYKKAELTWLGHQKVSRNAKDLKEIKERLAQIKEPLEIEEGYTAILSGKYKVGIEKLEPYLTSRFNTWWPLHYYLGVAYVRTGKKEAGLQRLIESLKLNPSHLETMEELLKIYKADGDKEKAEKYKKKIEIVKGNLSKQKKEEDF